MHGVTYIVHRHEGQPSATPFTLVKEFNLIDNVVAQIQKKIRNFESCTFEILDKQDIVGLILAQASFDPEPLQHAIDLIGQQYLTSPSDEPFYRLGAAQELLDYYKLKSRGLRQYIEYKLK